MNQGRTANITGNTLEQTVVGTLNSKGFRLVGYNEYSRYKDIKGMDAADQKYGRELLLRNVPYESIYGHAAKTEFLLTSARYNKLIRIECKWQQVSGSVDEKFPYLYLNCLEAMPEQEVIIIVDGGGAKLGGIGWLKNAAASRKYTSESNRDKLIHVMNLREFIVWTNRSFPIS